MKKTKSWTMNGLAWIEEAVEFVREELTERKVNRRLLVQAMLTVEEILVQAGRLAPENESVKVTVQKVLGDPVIRIRAKGLELEEGEDLQVGELLKIAEGDAVDTDVENAIRSIVLKAYEGRIRYRHKNGVNYFSISTGASDHKMLYYTMAALLLGICAGFLFRLAVPAFVTEAVSSYLLTPFKTMFINALKIVVGPLVFFSIVTCVSQFTNLAELGRIGVKVMAMYMLTTLFAVCSGLAMFFLIQPGTFGLALQGGLEAANVTVDMSAQPSILNTIVSIVPSNFVQPFLEMDTLQIIFLAILCGTAVGMIGGYSKILKELFEAMNALFLTITGIIVKLIPLAAFASIFLLVVETGGESLMALFGMTVSVLSAIGCMLIVYGLILLVFGRLNPLTFFRKNWDGMITSFTLASSCAAMPTNLNIAENKMGVSPKICSFSIPLGATVNMDGTSIYLAGAAMFLAKMYGVAVPASSLLSIVITIVFLSLGAPGVPGAAMLCLGVVLQQIGVPIEAIGIVMGVDALIDMFVTMSNTTGDMAVTVAVAKSEGLLDVEKYNS